jgi:hypothetical protein
VGNDKLAGRGDGVGEEIGAVTVEAVVGGQLGVGCPWSEVVEGQLSNGEEEMPEVGGEGRVDGGEDGNEVVFVSANGALGGVSSVLVGGYVLDEQVVGGEEGSEVGRFLVV